MMGDVTDIRRIDTKEIIRDPINWMDYTEADWRNLNSEARRELLGNARRYFEQVARHHRIPGRDFQAPLDDAVQAIRQEHAF